MKINVFAVGADGVPGGSEELNAFLGTHRVLSVDKALVQNSSGGAYWSFAVCWLDGFASGHDAAGRRDKPGGDKVDYKRELSEWDFGLFVKLRDLRKIMAMDEGVPMYMVFTNAQLAEMAKAHCTSKSALRKIEGVGESRVEKYGERFLQEITAYAKDGTVTETDRGAGEPAAGVLESGKK